MSGSITLEHTSGRPARCCHIFQFKTFTYRDGRGVVAILLKVLETALSGFGLQSIAGFPEILWRYNRVVVDLGSVSRLDRDAIKGLKIAQRIPDEWGRGGFALLNVRRDLRRRCRAAGGKFKYFYRERDVFAFLMDRSRKI